MTVEGSAVDALVRAVRSHTAKEVAEHVVFNRPYTSQRDYRPKIYHECGRCNRPFVSETPNKTFCVECTKLRARQRNLRNQVRKFRRVQKRRIDNCKNCGAAITVGYFCKPCIAFLVHNRCARCDAAIPMGRRYCNTCRNVRIDNSDARKRRLWRKDKVYAPVSSDGSDRSSLVRDGVPHEMFASPPSPRPYGDGA